MNKKMLLLLCTSSLSFASSIFNFENVKPISIEVETNAKISNTIEKILYMRSTNFKHDLKLSADLYEFAKISGSIAYDVAGKIDIEPKESGGKIELDFKKYGIPYISMYGDQTLTLGYKNETKIDRVKINGNIEYKLSKYFSSHTLKVAGGTEYTMNSKTDLKADVELEYSKNKYPNNHEIKPLVKGELNYKQSDNLSLNGKVELQGEIKILKGSNDSVEEGILKSDLSTEVIYKPIKNLTFKTKGELNSKTDFNKKQSSLDISTTTTVALTSSVAYDITKELHKVDRLVVIPSFEAKGEFSGELKFTPAVEAKYEIIKNLNIDAKAAAEINIGKTLLNKYGYVNSKPSLTVALNYKW